MELTSFHYRLVDVFTERPLEGNALAVFPRAEHLTDAVMQAIAREFNLSETVFVCGTTPDGAPRVRIFTPAKELTFAGHPTIGAAFVLRDEGIVPRSAAAFTLEEPIGSVPIRVDVEKPPRIWLRSPAITWLGEFAARPCAEALSLAASDLLGAPPHVVTAGNPMLFVAVKTKEAVDRAVLDAAALQRSRGGRTDALCVFVFTPTPQGAYSRMFAPDYGIAEDPATGSAMGPLAAYAMRHGLVAKAGGTRFVSEQGTKMGRRSFLHVMIHGEDGRDGIEVGGHVTPVGQGTLHVPLAA